MKKVDEGVDLFDEIWEKVYSAEQQNQKEKYEMDLKKEIKKLQRLRDQIKTWIGSSEVKDKDSLVDARRLIETKMEQFKVCEKETKTKTYSKEGLARAEKLDPAEEAKQKTTQWIKQVIDTLNQLVEDRDVEIERLSTGKGKKTNKHIIEEYNSYILNHKFHINKLEGIMRLVNNDLLEIEVVDEIKEDLEYYIEAHEDDEYIQSYDEDIFYEALGLDDLDVVNVDRVTQAQHLSRSKSIGSSGDIDNDSSSKGSRKEKTSKKTSSISIPLGIGRAKVNSGPADNAKLSTERGGGGSTSNTPVKGGRLSSSNSDSGSIGRVGHQQQQNNSHQSHPGAPALVHKMAPPQQGASMAAILKREGEQQEKERQQKAAIQQAQQQQLLREQQARQQAEQLRQQQLQRQQQEAQIRHQEALRQQQQAQAQQQAAAHQEALKRQQQQQLQEQQARQQQQQAVAQQEAAAKQQQLQAAQQQQHAQQQQAAGGGTLDNLLTAGLGGLSLGNMENNTTNNSPVSAVSPQQQTQHIHSTSASSSFDASASYLGALNDSYLHCPSTVDSERQKTYTPRNPYPTPSSYPSTPSPIFDHPAIFEKLGTDCLFFIFYYAQGTYQQYLAARELKKQSWRYHKKYMTWFQRHEEPKVTTDEYEQGTYVYFDYETGWCQRIKSDFRFEYSYLEDSLII